MLVYSRAKPTQSMTSGLSAVLSWRRAAKKAATAEMAAERLERRRLEAAKLAWGAWKPRRND